MKYSLVVKFADKNESPYECFNLTWNELAVELEGLRFAFSGKFGELKDVIVAQEKVQS